MVTTWHTGFWKTWYCKITCYCTESIIWNQIYYMYRYIQYEGYNSFTVSFNRYYKDYMFVLIKNNDSKVKAFYAENGCILHTLQGCFRWITAGCYTDHKMSLFIEITMLLSQHLMTQNSEYILPVSENWYCYNAVCLHDFTSTLEPEEWKNVKNNT